MSESAILLAGLATSSIQYFNGYLGQTGAVAGSLVLGAMLLWRSRPVAAGVLVGTLAFKPQYAVPLVLLALVGKNSRLLVGAASALAAWCGLSSALYGASVWVEFPQAVLQSNATAPYMINCLGLVERFASIRISPVVSLMAYTAVMVAFAGLLKWAGAGRASEAAAAAVLPWTLLVSPNTHPYDMLLLAPSLVVISGKRQAPLSAAVFWLVALVGLAPERRWLLSLGLACYPAVGLVRFIRANHIVGAARDAAM